MIYLRFTKVSSTVFTSLVLLSGNVAVTIIWLILFLVLKICNAKNIIHLFISAVKINVADDFFCAHMAAQLCCWDVMNVEVIFFIAQSFANHSITPVRASFSRSLIAPSSGHLIPTIKWSPCLLRQEFNISWKIRLILINYLFHGVLHICSDWEKGLKCCLEDHLLLHLYLRMRIISKRKN